MSKTDSRTKLLRFHGENLRERIKMMYVQVEKAQVPDRPS